MTVTENRFKRIIDIETGNIMVVTDLHGDWEAYQLYRDHFLNAYKQGTMDYLILAGDLIHYSGPPEADGSLRMVLDVMKLQNTIGNRIIYLMGNHELPHIYSITLQKGKHLYTPTFEAAMGKHRRQILSFFDQLPFYVRTRGGVTISHAGASAAISERNSVERLLNYSHRRIWRETSESLPPEIRPSLRRALSKTSNQSYDDMVRKYFAVTGPDDPRYDHFLIGAVSTTSHPDFQLLWEMLFTRNEYQYGEDAYGIVLNSMLQALSTNYQPQRVLVAGHIDCRGGYKIVSQYQLRMASAKHAIPRNSGLYLLFNAEKEIKAAQELVFGLNSVFKTKNP
ncbi:MAG: metallophosphoesterase family protein [Chloroflexota bacterium]|nr:metallophosphoesterase [Anaerolineales bacterium]MCB8968099.1 metallophosphoesterase [Ardenticatenaceae bacterium]